MTRCSGYWGGSPCQDEEEFQGRCSRHHLLAIRDRKNREGGPVAAFRQSSGPSPAYVDEALAWLEQWKGKYLVVFSPPGVRDSTCSSLQI